MIHLLVIRKQINGASKSRKEHLEFTIQSAIKHMVSSWISELESRLPSDLDRCTVVDMECALFIARVFLLMRSQASNLSYILNDPEQWIDLHEANKRVSP